VTSWSCEVAAGCAWIRHSPLSSVDGVRRRLRTSNERESGHTDPCRCRNHIALWSSGYRQVPGIQLRPRSFTFEYGDLLPEGEDFEGRFAPTPEEDADHGQDGEDEFGHELTLVTWRNLTRQPRLQWNLSR
jgi:hypothetical protein